MTPSDHPACPQCKAVVNMDDCDLYPDHVTYWGDVKAKPHTCWSCGTDIYLKENVHRWWVAGRTEREAAEL